MSGPTKSNLRLTIVAVDGLYKQDVFRFPDPFAVVRIDRDQVRTTNVVKRTLNPYWNESFDLIVSEDSILAIQVFDQRKFEKKDQGILGFLKVRIGDCISLAGGDETITKNLDKPPGMSIIVHGKIVFQLVTPIPMPSAVDVPALGSGLTTTTYSPSVDTHGLPIGWERRMTPDGRPYFVDHNTKSTSWVEPNFSKPVGQTTRATTGLRQELKKQIGHSAVQLQEEQRSRLANDHMTGYAYFQQKNYDEAERIFRRVADEQEKVLGSQHEDTLQSKHSLGLLLYEGKQNLKAAEWQFRQAANGREILLGSEHKDTLISKLMLGNTLFDQKKFSEAEWPLLQAVVGFEHTLGSNHRDTLLCRNTLGTALYNQKKYKEAESQLQLTAEGREKSLGSNHEDTLETISLLQTLQAEFAALSIRSPPVQSPSLGNDTRENSTADDVSNVSTSSLSITEQSKASHNTTIRSMTSQSTNSQSTLASRLAMFFPEGEEKKQAYNDLEISEISLLLQHSNASWSKVPRTYIVLRTIGQLHFLDELIDLGFSDYWFPVTDRNLPRSLGPSVRAEFLDVQSLVLTKSMDLEKAENGNHCHFKKGEPLPFESKEILGKGGYGQVDKVLSLISFREYARKRVPRSTAFKGRRLEDMKQFIAEIQILKRLKHHHIVEFVGSYTDPKHIGLVMSPVAEMDLSVYLKREDKNAELRTFFGCLATALEFLHDEKIRHKDIKPSNILVKGGNVFFTDFGLSMDFTDATGSTTVSMVNGMTPKYCAPEVALHQPRNTASDIWSLGVVFLEMVVSLKGRTGQYMDDFFSKHGSQQLYVRTNLVALGEFITELQGIGEASDNVVLGWVQSMLLEEHQFRPTASVLLASILLSETEDEATTFCGLCCVSSEEDEFDELDEE